MMEKRSDGLERLIKDRRLGIAVIVLLAAVLLAAVVLALFSGEKEAEERLVAQVTVHGVQVLAIDLYEDGLIECSADFLESEIEKKRKDLYFDLESLGVAAVLRLKNDRQICVDHSDCSDQLCVKCGYIGQLDQTIVCEQDGLKVQIVEKMVL
ncbi:MAG: hypothetical protein HFG26_01105 [Provencibacterium sp.]|nr:hypothetical protein [Provencibacterium sp.]